NCFSSEPVFAAIPHRSRNTFLFRIAFQFASPFGIQALASRAFSRLRHQTSLGRPTPMAWLDRPT
ncbi:MAG TPA: hypothetical protein VFQ61_19720, partial [Polyangiaceae bacterium]|nr:hypothetical protein [Polyangiaceae bacterium]